MRGTTLALNGLLAIRILLSLGFYVLVARRFGTSAELDVYWLAITPPLVVINLMEAAGVAASINYFTSLSHLPEENQRAEAAGFLYAWLLAAAIFVLALLLFAPEVAAKLGPGFSAAQQANTAALLRVSSIAMLAGPATIVGTVGILRVSGNYIAAAAISLVPPVVQIGALLAGVNTVSGLTASFGLAYVGSAVFALSQLQRVRKPAWLAPTFVYRDLLFRQLPPFVVAELILQLIYVRERSLASFIEPGAISALALALRLVAALGALASVGVEHTLAPAVSRLHSEGRHKLARTSIARATLTVGAFTLVPGVALLLAPDVWVRLAFRGGAFDDGSVALTSTVLVGYFGVYVFSSVGRVLIAATMSQRRAWHCVTINGGVLLLYVLLAPSLIGAFGLAGLALSTSIAFSVATVLYAVVVRRPGDARFLTRS